MAHRASTAAVVFVGVLAALCVIPTALATAAVNCNQQGIDLSQIPQATLTIPQSYQGKTQPYTWVLNFCQQVNTPPNGAGSCKDTSGNALAGYISEYSTSSCETTWSVLQSSALSNNVLTLGFTESATSNHPQWTATVTLSCGATPALQSTGNVMVTGPSATALNFAFTFTTSVVCGSAPATPVPVTPATPVPVTPGTPAPQGGVAPSSGSGGCGGGCAFTIIFFVGGFVYVAATVAFYYVRQGKRGTELLPHPGFWKEFAGCTKDGVVFSVQKVRALACKSGPYANTGYQAM